MTQDANLENAYPRMTDDAGPENGDPRMTDDAGPENGDPRMTEDAGLAKIPYYLQIRAQVHRRILSGQYRPGDKLPSEAALAREFGVSRMTVTKALQELVDREYLRRVQGGGTYVGKPTIEGNRGGILGLTRTMEDRGYALSTQVLCQEVRHPTRDVAEALKLPLGRDVLHLRRLRTVNGVPVVVQDTWIDLAACPNLAVADYATASLYEQVEAQTGTPVFQASDRIEAIAADADAAAQLQVAEGFPILKVRRVAHLQPGRPFEYAQSLYRSDQYVMEIAYGSKSEGGK